jgi:hypothetical protein
MISKRPDRSAVPDDPERQHSIPHLRLKPVSARPIKIALRFDSSLTLGNVHLDGSVGGIS